MNTDGAPQNSVSWLVSGSAVAASRACVQRGDHRPGNARVPRAPRSGLPGHLDLRMDASEFPLILQSPKYLSTATSNRLCIRVHLCSSVVEMAFRVRAAPLNDYKEMSMEEV
jgi:hypothetical protein